jgi:rod shape-determining protein MreD
MKPPVLAALAMYYALQRPRRDMWGPVFWAALLQDSLDPGPFGPALLSFPLIALLANRVRSELFVDGVVTHMICGFSAGLIVTFITLVLYAVSGLRPLHPGLGLLRLLGSGLLGMATLPLVSYGMVRLENALPRRKGYGWQ